MAINGTQICYAKYSINLAVFYRKDWLFAFAFNAKSFTISILVLFFLFFLLFPFLDGLPKGFSERFTISYQENVLPRSDSFLGHNKKFFRKNCCSSCYSRRMWHMTQVMHGNQHSQHLEKHKKQPETRRQVT